MKKFIIVLSFCMMMFGVTAFASTVPFTDIPSYSDVKTQTGKDVNGYSIWTYNGIYRIWYGNPPYMDNSWFWPNTSTVYECYEWNGTSWTYKSGFSSPNDFAIGSSSGSWTVPYATMKVTKQDGTVLNVGNTAFTVPPKPVAQVVQAGLGNLTTGFGGQLKVILPIGVTILAIMLGINLIPRLVHLYL
ncbi:hypothetical protein [Clostridium fungisolvens]|uniref:DUF2510 domain-containing protein n=1 Tax=Clostridium fungisolvens TaxID=1604897 RepID=A0A6V8SMX0_9CLOT|nr:hypothetical protein [Clostridium fungisolvens]GFP78559.1 hypothetical protein bsdtw1_04796 [Clostridium fungisolvens]